MIKLRYVQKSKRKKVIKLRDLNKTIENLEDLFKNFLILRTNIM